MSAKQELDHVLTSILGLTTNDRLHVCTNEHLRQCSRIIMTNVDSIDCDKLIGSLNHPEDKLRNIEFKFEGNFETLNESEIELILQLRHYVDHCWKTTSTSMIPF